MALKINLNYKAIIFLVICILAILFLGQLSFNKMFEGFREGAKRVKGKGKFNIKKQLNGGMGDVKHAIKDLRQIKKDAHISAVNTDKILKQMPTPPPNPV